MNRLFSKLFVFALLFFIPEKALSQLESQTDNITPDFAITESGSVGFAVTAHNKNNNNYLVVWTQKAVHENNSPTYIYARLYGGNGKPLASNKISLGYEGDYNERDPYVVYNPDDNEYLVVWGGGNQGSESHTVYKIYAQRINAANGQKIGPKLFLNGKYYNGMHAYLPRNPAAAYNPNNGEYFVVWFGNPLYKASDNTYYNEYEIYARRINAKTGQIIDNADIRISYFGPRGENNYYTEFPKVVHNPIKNHYLVAWTGKIVSPTSRAIYGKLLNADGQALGQEFLISTTNNSNANFVDLAHNTAKDEYLAVWGRAYYDSLGRYSGNEIFGQRLNANGTKIGQNEFSISKMGEDGNRYASAWFPSAAYRANLNQYIITWLGSRYYARLFVFGQLLNAETMHKVGIESFQISETEAYSGSYPYYGAGKPGMAINELNNQAIVTWISPNNRAIDFFAKIFIAKLTNVTNTPLPPALLSPKITLISPRKKLPLRKRLPLRLDIESTKELREIQIYLGKRFFQRIRKVRTGRQNIRVRTDRLNKGNYRLRIMLICMDKDTVEVRHRIRIR